MARRLQITGFARFLLLMVVLAPLAYIGASYYNGQDGIANFKKLIGIGEQKTVVKDTAADEDVYSDDKTTDKTGTRDLQKKVSALEEENESLRRQLDEKEQEIRQLKIKIDKMQQ